MPHAPQSGPHSYRKQQHLLDLDLIKNVQSRAEEIGLLRPPDLQSHYPIKSTPRIFRH
jgi:hypothetical protein